METLLDPQPPVGEQQAAELLEAVMASNEPAAMFALGDAIGEIIGL